MTLHNQATNRTDIAFQFASYFRAEWQPYFYILWEKLQDGHICVPKENLLKDEIRTLFPEFSPGAIDESDFISNGEEVKPIVELKGNLYLHRYFYYETIIIDKIQTLLKTNNTPGRSKKSLEIMMPDGITPDWQQVASAACLRSNFTIITGGPGTGKTTTVASILQLLLSENPGYRVALAAPTGKAAARMAESLKEKAEGFSDSLKDLFQNLEPSTIHRLLGNVRGSINFRHNKENPLNYDIIIIDESSMIDVAIFAKLLDAVSPETKLIMLGDKNQLASVEAGSLFGDLCNIPEKLNVFSKDFESYIQNISRTAAAIPTSQTPSPLSDHIVELQTSYRFSAEKGIGKLSHIIIHEDAAGLEKFLEEKDEVVTIDTQYDNHLFRDFVLKFKGYILEQDIAKALKKLNDCRILCVLREGKSGLYEINNRIESVLEKEKLITRNTEFYVNRPVIITKNNYALGLFNGDTGIVREDEKGNLKVWFDINGEPAGFSPALIGYADTAFALTIHKSQGSEFTEVMMVLPDYEVPILTKELVYTGITRAREHVLLQTKENILTDSITRSVQRGSGLRERF